MTTVSEDAWKNVDVGYLEQIRLKPIILVGKELVEPQKVAFHLKKDCADHLYQLPSLGSLTKSMFEHLGVKSHFSSKYILQVLKAKKALWKNDICGEVDIISSLLENLYWCMKKEGLVYEHLSTEDKESIFALDEQEHLVVSHELALADTDFTGSCSVKTVHGCIAPVIAKFIGVTSKKVKMVKECSDVIPFGQQESLTTRLNGLLKDYPQDESIMKELIQNADDAGATEVHFIKYFDSLDIDYPFGEETKLQPALCVYNNSYFQEADFEGIRNLGLGSKGNDPLKTGKYGLGFNAVYHLTDVPSFLTKGPNLGEKGTICIFDPLLKSIGEHTTLANPGLKFDVGKTENMFRDILKGYPDFTSEVGTMFRLPLRKEPSHISKTSLKESDVSLIIDNMLKQMHECLHFLKNITCLKVSSYSKGKLVQEYSVESELTTEDCLKRRNFFCQIRDTVDADAVTEYLVDGKSINVSYNMTICDSNRMTTKWHICNRFGVPKLAENVHRAFTNDTFGLLPLGGISLMLHDGKDIAAANCSKPVGLIIKEATKNIYEDYGKAFCLLPLPVKTGLPFHVNGHFAVDRARRGLLKQQIESTWNESIILPILVEVIHCVLQYLRWYWFEQGIWQLETELTKQLLNIYHHFFPHTETATDEYWKLLVNKFYTSTFNQHLQIFPSVIASDNGCVAHSDKKQSKVSIKWIGLSKEPSDFTSGMFDIVCSKYKGVDWAAARKVEHLLKSLGLLIIDSPQKVKFEIINAGAKKVVECDPEVVIMFLKTKTTLLGVAVHKTAIVNSTGVNQLLTFCMCSNSFRNLAEGLPLCLTNDSILRGFSSKSSVFCATECKLLTGSCGTFLNTDLVLLLLGQTGLFEKGYLRKLTVNDFCRLLPDTFAVNKFKAGKHVPWKTGTEEPIQPDIVNAIFLFVYMASLKDFSLDKKLFLYHLKFLGEWSFLPSVQTTGFKPMYTLIPIKESHLLYCAGHGSDKLEKIIRNLHLPKLDESAFQSQNRSTNSLRWVMASTDNPGELLKCLAHSKEKLRTIHIEIADAASVLLYMCKNLEELRRSDASNCQTLLKSLPFFETSGGNLKSVDNFSEVIVLPEGMPASGLEQWADINVVFLKRYDDLLSLYTYLGFKNRTNVDVYANTVVPRISRLQEKYLQEHIEYIKNDVLKQYDEMYLDVKGKNIVQSLKGLAFVKRGNTKVVVSSLYCKEHPVFKLMEPEMHFLPDELDNAAWMPFLKLLGLNTEPTSDMMLRYAKEVARNSALGQPILPLKEISKELCKCLFINSWDRNILQEMKHIKFVEPYIVCETKSSLLKSHVQKDTFIAFSKTTDKKWEDICWSSMAMLKHTPNNEELASNLEILSEPPLDNVLTHCQNLCDVLVEKTAKNPMDVKLEDICDFMGKIYKCLDEKIFDKTSSKNVNAQIKITERLRNTKFVFIEHKSTVTMINVTSAFTNGSSYYEVRPYLLKIPKSLQRYFQMFEAIGAIDSPSYIHYIGVLETIKLQLGDNPLPKNILLCAAHAIRLLVESLEDNKKKTLCIEDEKVIYLPNKDGILTKSSDLTVADNKIYEEKLAEKCKLNLFLGFSELQISFYFDPLAGIKNLPDCHRPRILSNDVSRNVCINTIIEIESLLAQRLQTFLRSTHFKDAICRLLRHSKVENDNFQYEESDEENIKANFSNVIVSQVTGLQTQLSYRGQTIEGTAEKKLSFIKNVTGDGVQEGQHLYKLFFQLEESDDLNDSVRRLLQAGEGLLELCRLCANKSLSYEHATTIQQLFTYMSRPPEIQRLLDRQGIKSYKVGFPQGVSVFPMPGTYVEEHFHPFIVLAMDPFKEHEFSYVAMEIENDDEENESSVFIYVNIIQEQKNNNPCSLLNVRYLVDVGERSENSVDVPLYKLYKFMPQTLEVSQEVQLLDQQSVGEKPFDENCREILKMLEEAWTYNETERKQIIKRLMKQWHPDRNMDRQEYAGRVFNFIKEVMVQLERDNQARVVISDMTGRTAPDMSSSRYSRMTANVEKKSKATAQAFHDNLEEYRSSGCGGRFMHLKSEKKAVHSIKEAKTWLKQAKNDFVFAQLTLKNECISTKGYNWICFICHQVSISAR